MTTATKPKTLKATGFVDERGELHLDEPLEMPPCRVSVLVEYDESETTAANDGRLHSVRQVCDFFVKKAKRLEVVQEIFLVGARDGCTEIWTVTSTARMDFESRYPVYDIQAEVSRATDRPIVGFHVVNLDDFPSRSLEDRLPLGAKSLWKREHAAAN